MSDLSASTQRPIASTRQRLKCAMIRY